MEKISNEDIAWDSLIDHMGRMIELQEKIFDKLKSIDKKLASK